MLTEDKINEIPEWFDAKPLSEFIAVLANELRMDLETIRAAAEVMKLEQALKTKAYNGEELDLVQLVTNSVEHAHELLSQVIRQAKIREGRATE